MTKDILKQYLDLKAEKEQLELEVKEFYDTCLKPLVLTGMPGSGRLADTTAEFAGQAARLHTKLLYKKHEVAVALEALEDAIAGLNPRERRLMREYYINGLTWEQVCVTMGYEWAQVHRIHKQALIKLSKHDTK
jgi:RNA polymerase sigma factor (sigma-70 family)